MAFFPIIRTIQILVPSRSVPTHLVQPAEIELIIYLIYDSINQFLDNEFTTSNLYCYL